ncbi:hypothetical protein Y1Q_0016583 [Alligator mississippiensis]|uniref:Uncharacterized protein n=1 Tax=Alligator mississippiensis TaxID=8496 RepID=A0A151MJR5_ALLMI|nr:hypothetical protein Y1Q_0016583 [Alligator mississippiensis]
MQTPDLQQLFETEGNILLRFYDVDSHLLAAALKATKLGSHRSSTPHCTSGESSECFSSSFIRVRPPLESFC